MPLEVLCALCTKFKVLDFCGDFVSEGLEFVEPTKYEVVCAALCCDVRFIKYSVAKM